MECPPQSRENTKRPVKRVPVSWWRELALAATSFSVLAVGLTYPLAFHPGSLGRTDNADGQFAIWNVAWVARTLIVDPLHVFDANIFHPHRWTLAYSEANLGAGLLAVPVYWLTGNPYAAFNATLLASFVLGGLGMYYLVRYLVGDPRAALIAAVPFAFCPYLFGHIPHIQLLMTAGLPFCLLLFHRLADGPTPGRAIGLGLAMKTQAVFCAYYGVFAMLMVGYAVLFTAGWRRAWTDRRYWSAIAIAAAVAVVSALPLVLPYWVLQSETGFNRSLSAAGDYSANWRMYLASNAYAHAPLMTLVGKWGELLFPGFIAAGFGLAGARTGWSAGGRSRELAAFYFSLVLLAFWVSLGPGAGLYRVLYATVPGFTFMRAPSRFGLVVALGLCALAGMGVARLLARYTTARFLAAAVLLAAIAELVVPLRLTPVPSAAPVYRTLATLPRGALLELPVYSHPFRFLRAQYMLGSTIHWMPLVVAYSDFIPPDFMESMNVLADFPSAAAFKKLEVDRVRYVVFHLRSYNTPGMQDALRARLEDFGPYLRRLHADEAAWLYEIVSFPPQ
jgi:hypothetical protein